LYDVISIKLAESDGKLANFRFAISASCRLRRTLHRTADAAYEIWTSYSRIKPNDLSLEITSSIQDMGLNYYQEEPKL